MCSLYLLRRRSALNRAAAQDFSDKVLLAHADVLFLADFVFASWLDAVKAQGGAL